MGTDTGNSNIDNINKDTDTFTSGTDNNNNNLDYNETRRQKQTKIKKGASKKKAGSRFVWEETPKELELFEFLEYLGFK